MSTQFIFIWSIDRTLSSATASGQSGPRSDCKEGVLCILQNSSINWILVSDSLLTYPGHSLMGILLLCRGAVGVFYRPSRVGHRTFVGGALSLCRIQSVYSTVPVDWAFTCQEMTWEQFQRKCKIHFSL